MTRILLGTAAGPGSDRAARWTAQLAERLDAELVVVDAIARRSAEENPDVAAELQAAAEQDLDEWTQHHGLAATERIVVEGSPEDAIAHAAAQIDPEMVVIGSTEEEGLTSLGLGSVAHRLAHAVDRPLIVVPPGDTRLEGGTVLVGVDGSSGSEHALRWGRRLAAALGGRLEAVTERGGSDPADTLRRVGEERDAAMLVVAARRRHSLGGLLLGSVVDHLLHRPTRPVAVLPRDDGGWAPRLDEGDLDEGDLDEGNLDEGNGGER